MRELVVELGLRSRDARELKSALGDLARKRKIVQMKKSHFGLNSGDRHRPPEPATRPQRAAEARGGVAQRGLVAGRLIGHRDGYGFVVPDKPSGETAQDIFVPAVGMSSAMHGDRVEVHVIRSKADGRLEGRIVRVTERAQRTVVGQFRCGARYNYVLPYDHRIPFEIVIPRGQERPEGGAGASRNRQFGGESEGAPGRMPVPPRQSPRDLENLIVDVELTNFPGPAALPRGRVIEVLGRRDEFGVDVEIIIRKYHLPHRFPAPVLAEAAAHRQEVSEAEREGRRDFRALPIVTIDGETAKDFDDAVYVERLPGGNYLLQVHIADVAHYVRPGAPLDREARLRGTSVYFPDRAVPMLPLELSNGICSLNPRVDRLAMSAIMEIDPEGSVTAYELLPGIIRSAERMTYTAVHAVLSGDAAASAQYGHLAGQFKLMQELALVLNRRRDRRGSIDFDLPEPLIEFDEHGRMIGVTRSERNIAHRIIEEFMLIANETVASYLEGKGVESLYRVHEKPDPKRVLEFEEIAAKFGYSLGIDLPPMQRVRFPRRQDRDRHPRFQDFAGVKDIAITSRHYQHLTERIEGKPEERILSFLMLRSLKQARYSEENIGHFALAASSYTHFTSPIRRYPDLIVHRILKAALSAEGGRAISRKAPEGSPERRRSSKAPGQKPARQADGPALPGGALPASQELHNLGVETSEAERRAADAERELMDWKKVQFMAGRLGDEFDALIISLIKHGFFVELVDLFVEGFVPLESFEDDRYIYQERLRALVGRRSGNAYHLGDRLRVRLDRIDREGNKLQFSVVG